MTKPTLLIDGDLIAYQVAAASEVPIQWDEDTWTLHSSMEDARHLFRDKVAEINDNIPNKKIIFALSPDRNYRYRIWPQYKANRKGKRRPLVLKALRTWLEEEYETFQRPDIEADDVLGILSTSPVIIEGEKIIVSLDKDMKTIPGKLCDTRTWDIKEVTEAEADHYHMSQTLIGDSADGYPGCPGMGPVGAEKLLDSLTTYAEMWPKVVQAYEKKGLGEEYALTMARLARICRRLDYDFKKKEVILWTPSL